MANHMHGMFAFALWDDEEKKLFCLRDQFGTKPFYYYETANGELLYSTSIRKIMEQPGRYLTWQRRQLRIERYWTPEFHPDDSKSLEEWAYEIHATLQIIMKEVKTEDS